MSPVPEDLQWRFVDACTAGALDQACLLIAVALDPTIDLDAEVARLDAIAAAVPTPTLAGVRAHLFGTLGLRGDAETYTAVDNSLLPRVLDRRRGMPITLSVVLIEVGRRLGVPLVGIGMPGHFLVRDGDDEDVFVDAFSGGVVLDRRACARVFATLHGDDVPFLDEYLAPTASLDIVRRVLANLRNSCGRADAWAQLAQVITLQTLLPDAGATDFEALAAVLERRGAFGPAADAAEAAADRSSSVAADRLRDRAAQLRARLN